MSRSAPGRPVAQRAVRIQAREVRPASTSRQVLCSHVLSQGRGGPQARGGEHADITNMNPFSSIFRRPRSRSDHARRPKRPWTRAIESLSQVCLPLAYAPLRGLFAVYSHLHRVGLSTMYRSRPRLARVSISSCARRNLVLYVNQELHSYITP